MQKTLNNGQVVEAFAVVDQDGNFSSPGSPGGPGGDASAAKQAAQIALETAIRDRLPSNSIFQPGTPRTATVPVALSVTTSATGTAWVAFGSQPCSSLDLVNTAVASTSPTTVAAAVNLRWRRVGQSVSFTLREGASHLVLGLTNADQVEVQRADGSGTQVTLTADALP